MPTIDYDYKSTTIEVGDRKYGFNELANSEFEKVSASALGLGVISTEGTYIQALAAMYDLEGFTAFCNQVDSHLIIPEFLTRYCDWMFATLRSKFLHSKREETVVIWGSLPFFAKFLGDGVLFLWDTSQSKGPKGIRNVVLWAHAVTREYTTKFLPDIRQHVPNPPPKLRCGIARRQVISVGDRGDYVGSCINVAARLQKLGGVSFAVS